MDTKQIYSKILIVALVLGLSACQTLSPDKDKAILDSLYQTAVHAELTGEHDAAISHFQNLLNRNPDDPDLRLALARNLRYSGAAKTAVRLLEDAKPAKQDQMAFQIELGKAKLAAGRTKDALTILLEASKQDPENWETFSALGIAYDLVENYDAARKAYEQAMVLSEDNPAILNNLAMSVATSGDLDGAIKLLKNAPRLARHNPHIRQNLAMLYGIKGDLKSAQALGRMDLDEETVQKNLLIYSHLGRK